MVLIALLSASAPLAPQANALDFSISIGDRGLYFGPSYWDSGYLWVWVPGYRSRGRWVHGHYARRGGWNRSHAGEHFRHHRRDRDRDRGDDRDRDSGRDRDRGRNRDRDRD